VRTANPLRTIGQTTDGQPVVGGVFALYDTYGYPFDLAFEELRAAGCIVGLADLYMDAIRAGWSYPRLRVRLEEFLGVAALTQLDTWHAKQRGLVVPGDGLSPQQGTTQPMGG